MKKALIIIDFINDIVSDRGKLMKKGYAKYIKEYNIIKNTNERIKEFRLEGNEIIFVKIQFLSDYSNQPKNSPLFGKANEFGIFKEGDWGSDLYSDLDINNKDKIFTKTRVSAFYNTKLEEYLRSKGIDELYFAGCATDLAIQSAVRDGHDRDFLCFVFANCCATTDKENQENSLKNLGKISVII